MGPVHRCTPRRGGTSKTKGPATESMAGPGSASNAQGVVYCPFASRPSWLEKLSATVISAPKRNVNAV